MGTRTRWIRRTGAVALAVLATIPIPSGAEDNATGWWSLRELGRPEPPPARPGTHPVDAFVEAALRDRSLEPVAAARPESLVRRLTFDLTGLPPTPAETAAYLAAHARDPDAAWAALIDRLLASPAYGEKMARHWLDLARYADTHGYDKDKPRENAWPYRDYVIASFNADKPYPRFVQEQVAGDVLFPGEPDGVLGLGFLAAGPWDLIAHTEVGEAKLDGRIAKHLDRDEMSAAVFNVFLSTTVQCAQCHDHKADPITMDDYYKVQAVFAAVDRADRVYSGASPAQQEERRTLLARAQSLDAERKSAEAREKLGPRASEITERRAALAAQFGTVQHPAFGFHSPIRTDPNSLEWVTVDLGRPVALAEIRLVPAYDTFAGIGPGFGFPPRFRIDASNNPGFPDGDATFQLHDATGRDHPNPRSVALRVPAPTAPVRYLRVTATRLAEREGDYIFALAELEAVARDGGHNLALGAEVTASGSIEAPPRWSTANLVDGHSHLELSDPAALDELHALDTELARLEGESLPPAAQERLAVIRRGRAKVTAQLAALPPGKPVFAAATSFHADGAFTPTGGTPRPIHVLARGDLENPGAPALPGAPGLWQDTPAAFAHTLSWDEADARAHLARYLTAPENPLVWRAVANRVWQWTMGSPLAATPNDFGRMGAPPTHPDLLDWLAARLRDDPGHSLKSLVRTIVTSEAYRRSSTSDPNNAATDADNAFLWRAHLRRLSAEEIRDSMLAVSGALRHDGGGPGFRDFAIEKPEHSPHYQYHLHDPDDPATHRRSIYRFVVRSQPHPLLTTLDAADPSVSVPLRGESTTALQALAQWNNRFVEAMSRRFAQRLAHDAPDDPAAQAALACRLALGRPPHPDEQALLARHARDHGPASLARVVFNLNAFVYVD